MNNLIRVEENQLIIAEKVINQIKELETKRKLIDEKEKEFKAKLEELMEKNNVTSFESNDKTLKISYTKTTTVDRFDSNALYKENPYIYRKYLVPSNRKGSVRITVREANNE